MNWFQDVITPGLAFWGAALGTYGAFNAWSIRREQKRRDTRHVVVRLERFDRVNGVDRDMVWIRAAAVNAGHRPVVIKALSLHDANDDPIPYRYGTFGNRTELPIELKDAAAAQIELSNLNVASVLADRNLRSSTTISAVAHDTLGNRYVSPAWTVTAEQLLDEVPRAFDV